MTTGDRPLAQFAAGVVGLVDGVGEAERLAALFRKLAEDDFLPDPLAHDALLALAGRPIGAGSLLGEAAVASEERKLHAEVEGFASEFFEIPVDSRADRWRSLALSCARHPRLIDRLRALKPGLGIDRGGVDDPSPPVKRLLDDLLDLFPLRPEARAVEARSRLEEFRSDPSRTPGDRDRASKQALKRHPAVAALLPGYLEGLGLPWRPTGRVVRAKSRLLSTIHAKIEDRPSIFVLLFVVGIVGGGIRAANSSKKTNPTPASQAPPTNIPKVALRVATPSPRPNLNPQLVRDHVIGQIKAKVRGEVARLGKGLDEGQLLKVVEGLPLGELPPSGGIDLARLQGYWTKDLRARFVDRLKAGLGSTDLKLCSRELDELADRCFPPPSHESAPRVHLSP